MRVELEFKTLTSSTLEQKVQGIKVIRLLAGVRFKTPSGWMRVYRAVVDTGAPISLLPAFVWRDLERADLAEHEIRGIAGKPECAIPVKIAKVTCFLEDSAGHQTGDMEIIAFLDQTDDVALLLGFKGLLAALRLHCDYRQQTASVEA
jgi:hypothetical protein